MCLVAIAGGLVPLASHRGRFSQTMILERGAA